MASYIEKRFTKIPLGTDFEDEVVDIIQNTIGEDCIRLSGSYEDRAEGTDATIYGLPCDITVNFYGKDHMEELPAVVPLDFATVRFGVRTGNSHNGFTPFENPVLVIGIDGFDIKQYKWYILNEFKKRIDEILEIGQDEYWNYIDAVEA